MKLLVSALERSANLHLSYLLPHLEKVELLGIFDNKLGRPLIDLQALSVMGFVDVFKKLPLFLRLKKEMVNLAKEADKILLIDSSGFNLPLAKEIKKRYPSKEIIYYILPQAWAWRRGRIKLIEKVVDKALSILPFERKFYSPSYNITYVGHPLLDEIKKFKDEVKETPYITFMPGSRRAEVKALMPIFKEVRKRIDKKAFLVVPSHLDLSLYGDVKDFEIVQDAHKALLNSSFAFICSGTATLEASLIGTPLALCYKAKPLDYFIAKRFAHIQKVGLANIMLGDVHPEFLQDKVTPKNLLKAYKERDPHSFLKNSKRLRKYLKFGSSKNVARVLVNGKL
ncbi:MAG: lipid-A-disaccharide synthase [Epsilonproteobacteria bacterium]|nr:lipid-A-disaccharide synthase [Campylobacterota bacterium]